MNTQTNMELKPAPLKDRMTVYLGAFVVILVSWLYIIGMGWHMNTLPFVAKLISSKTLYTVHP